MGYYDELINKINKLIADNDYEKAKHLIENELNMPYVPRDTERKLKEVLVSLPKKEINHQLNAEEIQEFLNGDETHQLRGVDELDKLNLRDYIDICNEYLCSDGFINAKVLLIDSLMRQDIGEEMTYKNAGMEYSFIPKYVVPPEMSLGYKKAIDILNDRFMKEPSKLELAKQLTYKECLLALPINYDEDDGELLADKVYEYIIKAFEG